MAPNKIFTGLLICLVSSTSTKFKDQIARLKIGGQGPLLNSGGLCPPDT